MFAGIGGQLFSAQFTPTTNNAFNIDLYVNAPVQPQCAPAIGGCSTRTSPNFLFTIPGITLDSSCQDVSFVLGGSAFATSVRLFRAADYPTSRSGPAPAPDTAAAAQTGIVVGSVGSSIAIITCCAMGFLYWHLSSKLRALSAVSTVVADWGGPQRPARATPALEMQKVENPAAAIAVNA